VCESFNRFEFCSYEKICGAEKIEMEKKAGRCLANDDLVIIAGWRWYSHGSIKQCGKR
jgi:hypothetical protein